MSNKRTWTIGRLGLALAFTVLMGCRTASDGTPPDTIMAGPTTERGGLCPSEQLQSSCFYKEDPTGRRRKLIVFVHGVFGSAASTWGDPKTERFWPRMVAEDKRFADFDIYLVNYKTPVYEKALTVHEVATSELSQLRDQRIFVRYTELHLVAHSMGGLVTKSMLVTLNRGADVSNLGRIKSVVYISTPAQGASIANLGAWLSLNPQLKDMRPAHVNGYIQSLEDGWVRLVTDRDQAKARYPRAYCAYETVPTSGVLVVPREMANSRCDGPPYPMPLDHHGVANPTRPEGDPYRWAMTRIYEVSTFDAAPREAKRLLDLAAQLHKDSRYDEARTKFEKARELSQMIGDPVAEGDALTGLGELEFGLDNYDEARKAFTEARSLYLKKDDLLVEARALLSLGDVEKKLGRKEQARAAYGMAGALVEVSGDRINKANVLKGLADLAAAQNNVGEARKLYKDAFGLYEMEDSMLGKANVLYGLGTLEAKSRNVPEARTAYEDSRKFYKQARDLLDEAIVLNDLARLEAPSNPKLAKEYFLEAARLFKAVRMEEKAEEMAAEAGGLTW